VELKADPALQDIPVIFITALGETTEKVRAFALGAVDYVTKPFQVEEIAARVRTHLAIRSLHRQLCAQNEALEGLVVKRTGELARAHDRLLELGRLKDDFLRMISHELRTPFNGMIGIGGLMVELCPPSEERELYRQIFEASSARLLNLIEDVTMISETAQLAQGARAATSFPTLLAGVRAVLPDIRITLDPAVALEAVFLKGNHVLLERALATMVRLAVSLSLNKRAVQVTAVDETRTLRLHLEVDDLRLAGERVARFFELESPVRSASPAEPLALAPVVAHRILAAFGGEMRLVKAKGNSGYVEAILPQEARHD
jgi:signal transduction histidine kinase